jgi:hypothetical protein
MRAKKSKAKAKAKKSKRIVLGVGHPFFEKSKYGVVGYQKVELLKEFTFPAEALTLNIENLAASMKIRLIAEVLA